MNLQHRLLALPVLVCLSFGALNGQALRMNETQVIGSHNSYKIGIEKPLMDLLVADRPEAIGLDYAHLPIPEQLDLGLRSLELDVAYDPEGGLYSQPKGLAMLNAQGAATQPYESAGMNKPGFKVLHIPDIDFRSHCPTFKACLSDIRDWSKAHGDHLPIIITINPKSSGVDRPGFAKVIPFDKNVLEALDEEILDVFETNELISPKLVKGEKETLRKAIVAKGWPALEDARGKVLFVLDAGSDLSALYVDNDEDYTRPMFCHVDANHPHAAFFIMNDPVKQEKEIAALVKQGFMVRTRSDADTKEARTGNKDRFQAAVRSGAQVITTDYYLKSLSPNKDFEITFDGKYSRCNPLLVKSSACNLK